MRRFAVVAFGCFAVTTGVGCRMLQNSADIVTQAAPGTSVSVVTDATSMSVNGSELHLPLKMDAMASDSGGQLLGDLMDKAYPPSRFAGLETHEYHSNFIVLRDGPGSTYIPLALVHRYELADFNVTPGAVVDIFKQSEVVLRFPTTSISSERPTSGSASISGLITNPGTQRLGPNGVQTLAQVRRLVVESLDSRNQVPKFDVMILTRLVNGMPSQFLVPYIDARDLPLRPNLQGAAKYDQGFRDYTGRSIENIILQNGDAVHFARLALLPQVISGAVREQVEVAVTEAVEFRRTRVAEHRNSRRTLISRIPGTEQLGELVGNVHDLLPSL